MSTHEAAFAFEFKAEVPPQRCAFYVVRTDGQPSAGIVYLNNDGKIESVGSTVLSDPEKMVRLPSFPYMFGPRLDMSDDGEVISMPW